MVITLFLSLESPLLESPLLESLYTYLSSRAIAKSVWQSILLLPSERCGAIVLDRPYKIFANARAEHSFL